MAATASKSKPSSAGKLKHDPVLVIHGGAGVFARERATPEQRALYKAALRDALLAGHEVLKGGENAMDAAVAAVANMEDCPLFNCAKGAVFNVAGKNELEASIALSNPPFNYPQIPASRKGVSVTLMNRTRNPSRLVRALYTTPLVAPHAFLSGSTAELEIGHDVLGTEIVDPSYYFTEQRWREHRRGLGLPEDLPPSHLDVSSQEQSSTSVLPSLDMMPTGTVGAVALDGHGCIAVVTSTGGKTNKLVGRIGDTPSMGSGFWAEEWSIRQGFFARVLNKMMGKSAGKRRAVGVSGTGDGDGDYFIRCATATTLATRMKLLNEGVLDASVHVVEELRDQGGIGGVIALDESGRVAFALNCNGMYRGFIRKDGIPKTAIFDDDKLE